MHNVWRREVPSPFRADRLVVSAPPVSVSKSYKTLAVCQISVHTSDSLRGIHSSALNRNASSGSTFLDQAQGAKTGTASRERALYTTFFLWRRLFRICWRTKKQTNKKQPCYSLVCPLPTPHPYELSRGGMNEVPSSFRRWVAISRTARVAFFGFVLHDRD